MSIPVHLTLIDSNGVQINGSSKVIGREGTIEILRLSHGLHIPFDGSSGRLTGTRVHSPIVVEKDIDKSSPYLYRAVCQNTPLKSGLFSWYQINDAGQECEFFTMMIENIRITAINPTLPHVKHCPHDRPAVPGETLCFAYQKITWTYREGHIQFTDEWNNRTFA